MSKLFVILISLGLIGIISGECFKENATSGEDCESRAESGHYCCLIEYRTNLDPNYKKVCVPIIEEDIEDGKYEETLGTIEGGNYTNSGWNETIMETFRDYASISEFDCKGYYFNNIMLLVNLMIIFFLI